MAEQQTPQPAQPGSEAVTLSQRDREQVHKLFSNPLEIPVRFKGWMEAYLEPLIRDMIPAPIRASGTPTGSKFWRDDNVLANPPGTRLGYQQFTSIVQITGSNDANANVVVTAPSVALDGATRICVKFFSPGVESRNNNQVFIVLYDSLNGGAATELGRIANVFANSAGISTFSPVNLEYEITPAAGSHVYSVRVFCPSPQGQVFAGAGGGTAWVPGFIKISTA